MKKIFKYEMSIKEKQEIELPVNAEIIRVDDVDGKFFLWAIVEPPKEDEEPETEVRYIEFYKTGQPIETPTKDLKYIGFCKLFIMQELGLYVFENIAK
ncbi:DUF7352 domain-containing protein [Algibacter sp. PT7-4]|uniref:DUF7352 domain-containing protein n=1 Tax=Algibacter ulvanivorans TaxID=3400999 RepID=UPI003AAD441B